MRVLFVLHDREKSGANRSLLELVDGLSALGVECFACVPGTGVMTQEFSTRGIACISLLYRHWMNSPESRWKRMPRLAANLAATGRLSIQVARWNVDLVHSNSSVTPVGAMAAFLARRPHVWHIREFGQEDFGLEPDWGLRATQFVMRRTTDHFIAVSHALRLKYSQILSPEKVSVIYNPVSLRAGTSNVPQGNRRTCTRLVLVGALTPGKGQSDAIMAVADLARRGIEVSLDIVGSGQNEYLKQLRRLAQEQDVGERVHFLGYLEDPSSIGAAAVAHLVCSRSEGFGRTTVEAMLLGKPVVAARGGGTLELVREGFNGLLYEPGDYGDLARRIQYLLEHPSESAAMGLRGREWASAMFAPPEHAQQILELYERVLEHRRGART